MIKGLFYISVGLVLFLYGAIEWYEEGFSFPDRLSPEIKETGSAIITLGIGILLILNGLFVLDMKDDK